MPSFPLYRRDYLSDPLDINTVKWERTRQGVRQVPINRRVVTDYQMADRRTDRVRTEGPDANQGGFPILGVGSFPSVLLPNDELAYARAFNSLQNGAKGMNSGASLAETLAESGQSYAMIASNVKRLAEVAKYLRDPGKLAKLFIQYGQVDVLKSHQRSWSRYRSHLRSKRYTDAFLEVEFGWRPLITDIQNACEVVSRDHKTVASGFGRNSKVVSNTGPHGSYPVDDLILETSCSQKISVEYFVRHPAARYAQELGLLDPVATGVNLIPFSFVVGWFTNLSSWLTASSMWYGLQLTKSYTNRRLETTGNRVLVRQSDYPPPWLPNYVLVQKAKSVEFWRVVTGQPAPPSLQVTAANPFGTNIGRGLDATALLLQRLTRLQLKA